MNKSLVTSNRTCFGHHISASRRFAKCIAVTTKVFARSSLLQLWNEQVTAQSERFQSIQNPIDFIDWFSYGLFSANQSRGNTMLADPSLYNISNWLTSGIPDTAKGTLFPDKPFSPEHWLNSFEMASLFMGSLKLAQSRAAMFDPKGAIDGEGRGSGGVGGTNQTQLKPPGWNDRWEWRYPEANKPHAKPRWFDLDGGEWRWHAPDQWHPQGHWDYNPWDSWNSKWQNIDADS